MQREECGLLETASSVVVMNAVAGHKKCQSEGECQIIH